MPKLGKPVEVLLSSGLIRVASLDLTEANGIYLWCCEHGGVFYSLDQVVGWRLFTPPVE